MKVELIESTPHALELLLLTKGTRLQHDSSLEKIRAWPEERKLAELAYMKDTIKSSWEFVNFTFRISGVSRAFTHQFVRTRTGRYAQESMRTVDARGNGWLVPEGIAAYAGETQDAYNGAMEEGFDNYAALIDRGVPQQDARNVLPTGALTSIIAQFSLRTLHEMATTRLCVRTQGEYQSVFRAMKAAVVEALPWAEPFIRVGCAQNGICVFPRYTECPIRALTFNALPRYAATVEEIARMADGVMHEARPVAREGRTM
jgi:flavin-dependent thymidylate synthase